MADAPSTSQAHQGTTFVKLTTYRDWPRWYDQLESYAQNLGVWDFVRLKVTPAGEEHDRNFTNDDKPHIYTVPKRGPKFTSFGGLGKTLGENNQIPPDQVPLPSSQRSIPEEMLAQLFNGVPPNRLAKEVTAPLSLSGLAGYIPEGARYVTAQEEREKWPKIFFPYDVCDQGGARDLIIGFSRQAEESKEQYQARVLEENAWKTAMTRVGDYMRNTTHHSIFYLAKPRDEEATPRTILLRLKGYIGPISPPPYPPSRRIGH